MGEPMASPMIPPSEAPDFLAAHGWAGAEIRPLAGDASFRRYFRVHRGGDTAVLMDAPPQHEDVGRSGLPCDLGEYVHGGFVDVALALRLALEKQGHPFVAEILEQKKAPGPVDGERTRRREAPVEKMAGDLEERLDILLVRRGVHQDRALAAAMDPEIAAEARVAGERTYLGALPAMLGEELGRGSGGNHGGGHRVPQAGGTRAVKARAPSPARRRLSRSDSGHRPVPSRSGHSISKAAY